MRCIVRTITLAVSLFSVNAYSQAATADEQQARVSVYAHTIDGKPAYTYTVRSTGEKSVLGLAIGFDHHAKLTQLKGPQPLKIIAPKSWEGRVVGGNGYPYEIRWEPKFWEYRVKPNSEITGFTVVMNEANERLLTANWTAHLSGGKEIFASSQVQLANKPKKLAHNKTR